MNHSDEEMLSINSLFLKLSNFYKDILLYKKENHQFDYTNFTIKFKELFNLNFPTYPQILDYLIINQLYSFPLIFQAEEGKIFFLNVAKNNTNIFHDYKFYYPLLNSFFKPNYHFLSIIDNNTIQPRNKFYVIHNSVYGAVDVENITFANEQSSLIKTNNSINVFKKYPESFIKEIFQTISSTPNETFEKLRKVFEVNNIKSHKIRNFQKTSEIFNNLESVLNPTESLIYHSIIRNFMLNIELQYNCNIDNTKKISKIKKKI